MASDCPDTGSELTPAGRRSSLKPYLLVPVWISSRRQTCEESLKPAGKAEPVGEKMESTLSLLKGVSLQVSLIVTIRDKLPFLILALNPLKITHAGSEGKKDPMSQEQAMKIKKIKTGENHSIISGLVERVLSLLWLAGSPP